MNEELGLALISQQGMAQPAAFSLPQAHGAGLRTYEPAQDFWATVAGSPAHFPVSLRSPPHCVASVWRLAEGMGDGADNQGGLLLQGLPCPIQHLPHPRLPLASLLHPVPMGSCHHCARSIQSEALGSWRVQVGAVDVAGVLPGLGGYPMGSQRSPAMRSEVPLHSKPLRRLPAKQQRG